MNWTNIRDEYPNAFNSFIEDFLKITNVYKSFQTLQGNLSGFNVRDLYDFFDSKGIFISVQIQPAGNIQTLKSFNIDIYKENGEDTNSLDEYWFRTRAGAELQAFEKAFELLEKKSK